MRILKFAGLAVLVIVVLVSVAVFVYLKTRIPAISGTLKTKEVTSEVKIIRDAYGVPHIEAVKSADLYFALGYVQAQDRLFQMDFYRRAARDHVARAHAPQLAAARAGALFAAVAAGGGVAEAEVLARPAPEGEQPL